MGFALVRFPDWHECQSGERTPPERVILLQRLLAVKKWLEPPHMTHIVGFCSMWTMPGSCQNLGKSIQVVARADLAPPPVCPLSPHQFVHFWLSISQKFCCCISQYFISYLFSTVMDPDFSGLIYHPLSKIQGVFFTGPAQKIPKIET